MAGGFLGLSGGSYLPFEKEYQDRYQNVWVPDDPNQPSTLKFKGLWGEGGGLEGERGPGHWERRNIGPAFPHNPLIVKQYNQYLRALSPRIQQRRARRNYGTASGQLSRAFDQARTGLNETLAQRGVQGSGFGIAAGAQLGTQEAISRNQLQESMRQQYLENMAEARLQAMEFLQQVLSHRAGARGASEAIRSARGAEPSELQKVVGDIGSILGVLGIGNYGGGGGGGGVPLSIGAIGNIFKSDKRAKEDIRPIRDASDRLSKLRGIRYRYLREKPEKFGFTAQNVESVVPGSVIEDETGTKYITLHGLAGIQALVVENLKALRSRVEALEAA